MQRGWPVVSQSTVSQSSGESPVISRRVE